MTRPLPTPHTVTRSAFTPGSVDALNNAVDAWGAPGSVAVHGWAPPSADATPFEQARSAIIRDLDLLVPVGTVNGPRDRWTVGGVVYEQVGHAEDYSHGPFGFTGGLRINLRRAEG